MRRLAVPIALVAALMMVLAGCSNPRGHGSLWITHSHSHLAGVCLSADCGPYAAQLHWDLSWPGHTATGYYVYLNGTQEADVPRSPWVIGGGDCGTTVTLGVRAHDGSGNTSGLYTSSYTTPACSGGTTWFVSKAATGGTDSGTSWTNAWTEMNQINWASVQPGDTIMVDGGSTACTSNGDFTSSYPGVASCGMVYTTELNPTASGSSGSPITIELSTASGRNGTAVFNGGRTSPLPYCGQAGYSATGTARSEVMKFSGSYITLDGMHRSGFMVDGGQHGIQLQSTATHDGFVNMEIFDNGTFVTTGGGGVNGAHTDQKNVALNGSNLTFDRDLIHDAGQDDFQDDGTAGIHDITIENSWIYMRRDHPTWTGYSFNSGAESTAQDCTHVDGIQVFGAFLDRTNLTIQNDIFGPMLGQSIYPGDGSTPGSFDNVTIHNVLSVALLHAFQGDAVTGHSSTPANWTISNLTAWYPNANPTGPGGTEPGHGDNLSGTGHSLTNSVFLAGFFVTVADFTGTNSGNVYLSTSDPVPGGSAASAVGVTTPPAGQPNSTYAQFAAANYTPTCTVSGNSSFCSGKGSSLHTFSDILNLIDTINSTNP